MAKDKGPFAPRALPFRTRRIQRIQRIANTPTFKVAAIAFLLFLGLRWVIAHNHESDDWPGRGVKPTKSVQSFWINWDNKQYVQIVGDEEKLCSAVMAWYNMEEIGSRASRTMLYPADWDPDALEIDTAPNATSTRIAHLLRKARDEYYVKLQPVEALRGALHERGMWKDSYIKLLAFNMTMYSKVLVLDSASVPLGNLDSVFLLPKAPLAMPWVNWEKPTGYAFSNQMMLIRPSASEFAKIEAAVEEAGPDVYDLTIVENLYKDQILKIPEQQYHLTTGEFRRQDHSKYLGSTSKPWDPDAALSKAKFLHFSDWPIPRPWASASQAMLNRYMPKCLKSDWFGATNCRDRTLWLKLYTDYALKRKGLCGSHFEVTIRDQEPDGMIKDGRFFHAAKNN